MKKHSNVEIKIDDKFGMERALRKFKRLCESYGIVKEYRTRKEYKKPSVKEKEKRENAEKRLAKQRRQSRGSKKI